MKLIHILEKYDSVLLDQISADKVDEAISLRLPGPVIVQEIISALGSQSYISEKILFGKPPIYVILNLILQSPNFMIEVEGFKNKVLEAVQILAGKAAQYAVSNEKHPQLYIKILRKAWENDGLIDKSEAHILEVVKHELGIWDIEHFILMHDASIIELWDMDKEYYLARNQLLSTGVMMTFENKYIIAEEVAVQVRKTFGIELMDDPYKRLLTGMTKEDLVLALSYFQLNVSGSKDSLIERLLKSPIPPSEVLNQLHLESLRDICRRQIIQVGGSKSNVITNIIHFFDDNKDLKVEETEISEPVPPPIPEVREMSTETYGKILINLTGQQLYDILYQSDLMTSGSKEDKIKRILNSSWSERTVFNYLRKEDLIQLCRKFGLPISGSKREIIDRVLDYTPSGAPIETLAEPEAVVVKMREDAEESAKSEIPVKIEPSSLPPNWSEINAMFPDLGQDEKIVLAILKDAKSITEQDLERIVKKHNIPWFLYKANMAELMAKLKRDNKPFIKIKSVQNTNIYQWTSNESPDNHAMEKKSARDIIDALRHGVVPKHNLNLLMVGQQIARKHLAEILLEVNSHKSHFKFISGQYGSGKTFLCSWLKEFALDKEFVVSFMNISHDQPLSDLPVFFSGMINGLRTPEKTDSSALIDILESWLLNIHNKTAKIEGIDPGQTGDQKVLSQLVEKSIEIELSNLNDIEPGFAQALRAFYEGKVKGNMELSSNAVAWITGSRSLSSQALREIGVKGYLEANMVFSRMRAILEIIIGDRYKGLLLLVDELELVRKFPHVRQRELALETLRLLIDEAGRNGLPGCLIIFTGTDEFFEDERYGLKSYEALSERVKTHFTHEGFVSMRQPIISLEALDRQRLSEVIFKIRELYGIAYSCDVKQLADDESITKMIEWWTLSGKDTVDRKPRPILREFIQMLDLCEENKGVILSQFLKKPQVDVLSESSFRSN